MSYRIRLLPIARRRGAEASRWYAERSVQAGENFRKRLRSALDKIEATPETYKFYNSGVRRYLLKPYPYLILYRIDGDDVVVVNIFHAKRNPKNWRR